MKYVDALKEVNRKKIFFILAASVFVLFLAYGYFMGMTLKNIVARQDMARQISQLSSDVATLESSYMAFSSELTMDHAYALGFNDVKSADTVFVERSVDTVALR